MTRIGAAAEVGVSDAADNNGPRFNLVDGMLRSREEFLERKSGKLFWNMQALFETAVFFERGKHPVFLPISTYLPAWAGQLAKFC